MRKELEEGKMGTAGKAFYTERKLGKDEPETFWETYKRMGVVGHVTPFPAIF